MNNDKDRDFVPYIVHESSMARCERTIKRLVIALIFSIVLMFTCNALWLLAWTSYDYVSTETTTTDSSITVDGKDGIANYVGEGGNGDINYGEGGSKENQDSHKNEKPNTKGK